MGMTIHNGSGYNSSNTNYANKFLGALANLTNFTTTGSGSFGVSVKSIYQQNQHSNTHIFLKNPTSPTKAFSVAKQLELIKSSFLLKDEELADAVKASRRTVHTWKVKEDIPRDLSSKRVFELFILSRNWKNEGFEFDRTQLRRKIMKDNSIFDMLIADDLNAEKILFAGNALSSLPENDKNIELI